ncbi:hypothetical protein B0H13DRAFT_2520202 [Mycena leptocephala]|nr:hypothetical protein B0H13DRAFT_2520202 [Mycena leptocephala]
MHRSHFCAVPSKEPHLDDSSRTTEGDNKSADTLLNSATTLLRTSREAPKRSALMSSPSLRIFSFILHSALVAIHLGLIGIWAKRLEHHLVFSLDNQTLSMRHSISKDQPLTATHDHAAAWHGIGSAVFYIWHQRTAPASIIGVLSVFLYLGNILVLHITTPALFSLKTCDASRSVLVGTQGLPALKPSGDNSSEPGLFTALDKMSGGFASGSLYYLPYVNASATIGLHEGTLYDVLEPNTGTGNASVEATGFNITCGSWEGNTKFRGEQGVIACAGATDFPTSALPIFYSTIPIIDSTGDSRNRLFRCSLSLVDQTAVVEPQSGKIITVEPDIKKNVSSWLPSVSPNAITGNPVLDAWGRLLLWAPASDFPFDYSSLDSNNLKYISVSDLYLIQKLGHISPTHELVPTAPLARPPIYTLRRQLAIRSFSYKEILR